MPTGKYTRNSGPRNPRPAIFPVGPSIAYIQLSRGLFSCVDWDDAIELQSRNWSALSTGWGIYAVTTIREDGKVHFVTMHSFLLKAADGMTADHKYSKEKLLNCKFNLRLATKHQQSCNTDKHSNNTTGFKGVHRHRDGIRYVAKINVNRKQVHLGIRDTAEEAASLYREAAVKLHGEFANY